MAVATASTSRSFRKVPLAVVGLVVVVVSWASVLGVEARTAPTGLAAVVINSAVAVALVTGLVAALAVSRYWSVRQQQETLVRRAEEASLAAAISHSLAEGSLDAQAAATAIAGHLAASIGDACVISLFSEAGPLVPTVVRANDPRLELAVRAVFPVVDLQDDDPYLTGRAVATSVAQQAHGSTDAVVASSRAALTELFDASQTQSLLVVPMRCFRDTLIPRRGQAVGTVYMMRCSPDGYTSEEVSSLQDAADRAGAILASASLHRVIETAEQRFRTIFEDAPIGVAVVELTGERRFVAVNDQFCRLTGYAREDLLAMTPQALVHPEDRVGSSQGPLGPPFGPDRQFQRELRYVRADGQVIWVRLSASTADIGGGRDAIVHVEDVTEKILADEALAMSEARFRSTFEHSPAGLAMVSLEQADRGRVLRANAALSELTGRGPGQLAGMSLSDLLLFDDDAPAADAGTLVQKLLSEPKRQLSRWVRADGLVVWARVSVAELPGQPRRCLVQVDDVTAQKLAEEDLAFRAMHDHLTALPNRHLAMDHLRLALCQLSRTRGTVAVLFVDLDLFKRVNDTMGHEVGDEVLRQLGRRLATEVRAPDTAARLGGDEFLVVCSVAAEEDAGNIVQRVQQAVGRPVHVAGKSFELTASIGVAVTTRASSDPDELVRQADAAMYEAKHGGRHRWQVYNERLHHRARARQAVELDLRRALKKDLFRLLYQPIFDLSEGRLVGAEALLRMEQMDGKLVFPGSFIGVAEDTDLIRPISDWVLDRVCAQMAEWGAPSGFHLAVNLSGRDLSDLTVTSRVLERAQRHGVTPDQLVLELTEGVLIDGDKGVVRELARLREAGARLAIDDFGTGYCSLTYLERFPVDTVKIDRSFVAGLGSNLHATAIVEAVVALSKTLNLTCVAEGIEEPAQAATLAELGCQLGQGFYFGAAMPAGELANLFTGKGAGDGRGELALG